MEQWDVWYASFPYEENPNIRKNRPVIILDVKTMECLSVKVTSKNIRESDEFDVEIKHWDEAGLKAPSVARVSKTIKISKEAFNNRKGVLHLEDRLSIMNKFKEYISKSN